VVPFGTRRRRLIEGCEVPYTLVIAVRRRYQVLSAHRRWLPEFCSRKRPVDLAGGACGPVFPAGERGMF